MNKKYAAIGLMLCGGAALLWFAWHSLWPYGLHRRESLQPEEVLQRYLRAIYARDYTQAYPWISDEDRKIKSREDYLRENLSFTGPALRLSKRLAGGIVFSNFQKETEGDRAALRFHVQLPDANDSKLRDLLLELDSDRLGQLSENQLQAIEKQIDTLTRQGQLPMLDGQDKWDLVHEPGGWRVIVNWASAVRVVFAGEVKEGLPWSFAPLQASITAKPGETLRAVYKAKNLSKRPVTAKARHRDEPKEIADKYLEIIQCFCFIQQTLAPGEEIELPLVFRVNWDTPEEVREFRITYEFYPIDRFPGN